MSDPTDPTTATITTAVFTATVFTAAVFAATSSVMTTATTATVSLSQAQVVVVCGRVDHDTAATHMHVTFAHFQVQPHPLRPMHPADGHGHGYVSSRTGCIRTLAASVVSVNARPPIPHTVQSPCIVPHTVKKYSLTCISHSNQSCAAPSNMTSSPACFNEHTRHSHTHSLANTRTRTRTHAWTEREINPFLNGSLNKFVYFFHQQIILCTLVVLVRDAHNGKDPDKPFEIFGGQTTVGITLVVTNAVLMLSTFWPLESSRSTNLISGA